MAESSGSSPSLNRCTPSAALGNTPREGSQMKKQRDLNVSIGLIRSLLTRDGLEPEQMNALENALKTIKQLRRSSSLDKVTTYQAVRTITEDLVKAFVKHY
jgi:hypothetical protein